jgi:hypothetical protein
MAKSISSNLPPGCGCKDLPGNSPGDQAWEEVCENFYAELEEEEITTLFSLPDDSPIHTIIAKAIEFGIDFGMNEQAMLDAENEYYREQYEAELGVPS